MDSYEERDRRQAPLLREALDHRRAAADAERMLPNLPPTEDQERPIYEALRARVTEIVEGVDALIARMRQGLLSDQDLDAAQATLEADRTTLTAKVEPHMQLQSEVANVARESMRQLLALQRQNLQAQRDAVAALDSYRRRRERVEGAMAAIDDFDHHVRDIDVELQGLQAELNLERITRNMQRCGEFDAWVKDLLRREKVIADHDTYYFNKLRSQEKEPESEDDVAKLWVAAETSLSDGAERNAAAPHDQGTHRLTERADLLRLAPTEALLRPIDRPDRRLPPQSRSASPECRMRQ